MSGKSAIVSAPAKVIISGEYSVLYGAVALATAVDRRLRVNKDFVVESQIPIGCGMGSSAAYAVAISAMEMIKSGKGIDKEKVNEMAYKKECEYHGNSSGLDTTISTYGGYLKYQRLANGGKVFEKMDPNIRLPQFVIFNTGKPMESTKEMVGGVAYRMETAYKKTRNIVERIGEITDCFVDKINGKASYDYTDLIRENEKYLEMLGVVSESTKKIIKKIEDFGGAAKISGAGGSVGASGIVLAYHSDIDRLASFLQKMNMSPIPVEFGVDGVKEE